MTGARDRVAAIALVLGLISAAAGCSSEGSATTVPGSDAACRQFREVVSETAEGNLNERQLRDEFEEIYDLARYSGTQEMASAATRVIAALTMGDMISFEQAFRDMDAACRDAGF